MPYTIGQALAGAGTDLAAGIGRRGKRRLDEAEERKNKINADLSAILGLTGKASPNFLSSLATSVEGGGDIQVDKLISELSRYKEEQEKSQEELSNYELIYNQLQNLLGETPSVSLPRTEIMQQAIAGKRKNIEEEKAIDLARANEEARKASIAEEARLAGIAKEKRTIGDKAKIDISKAEEDRSKEISTGFTNFGKAYKKNVTNQIEATFAELSALKLDIDTGRTELGDSLSGKEKQAKRIEFSEKKKLMNESYANIYDYEQFEKEYLARTLNNEEFVNKLEGFGLSSDSILQLGTLYEEGKLSGYSSEDEGKIDKLMTLREEANAPISRGQAIIMLKEGGQLRGELE